ncbi:unnamed protein product [Debaryomyces fabryi]|nr:unnamed protein product [Debaryomyces fabryi]
MLLYIFILIYTLRSRNISLLQSNIFKYYNLSHSSTF